MRFEKDGMSIDVSKVMWDGSDVTVNLTRGTQYQDISCSKLPHSDFKEALEDLKDIFLEHMELEKEDFSWRISMTGVEERETKNGRTGYRIHAVLSCPGTSHRLRIASSTLTIPAEGFFEWEDEDGYQKNAPEDYLYFLQDHEIEAIEHVFQEGFEYAVNGKIAKPEQPDLLDSAEESEEAEEEDSSPGDDEIPSSLAFPDPDEDF